VKIAFALIPEKGHINPYIGPAQALADLGHDVVIAAPGDVSEQIGRAGLAFRSDLILPPSPGDRVTRGAELVELIQDPARLGQWIEQLLLDGIEEQVPLLRDWYVREEVQAVVVDPLYYPAAIAAHQCGLPWASVSNSLNPVVPPGLDSELINTVARLKDRRAALFRSYRMEPAFSVCDIQSPYLTIAFATEELVGPPPPGVTLVGPSFPLRYRGDEFPLGPLPPNKPVVYASFGSQIYHWPQLFENLIEAALRIGPHLVLSVGDLVDHPRFSAAIPHCDVYRYAPQLAVLRQASVFVTHGGANSVMEAAACGVPMLVSPMCNDQFHQAYFVDRAGIGCVEDLNVISVELLAERLKYLIADPAVRARSARVAESYRADGSGAAARLIERLGRRPC
jgi:UDP:flavonoid glycosyltransferase YjiC (YdhE family)